ncbi:maleylacetate reductase [Corynebacterium sp. YIM 101645]|uniref:Maleylacetate reductase n=1 Tax=Corynebacterium lemuris TaxID=1859292 RepID=A0ABT2G072_9CORY|nr:maleylacetate reductase [Corynebacterium lemuris]MCS5480900.1 maleylacetate reductase [Corynebacterium lemuris]
MSTEELEMEDRSTDALSFEHITLGQKVLFGAGKAADFLVDEVRRKKAERVMVIAGGRELGIARQVTSHIDVHVWHDEVVMHVPVEVAERARVTAREKKVDLLVCVGGGSTVGLAKAVALTEKLPVVAVPTTYAGSEATNVWGLTKDERKTTGVDDAVLPQTVIYDPELTLSLPVDLSVASGLNALAHCVDSLWAPKADPINAALAVEGIRALSAGLPAIVQNPQDMRGREMTLYGAYLSAVAFASAGSGIHHKICHTLGGTFDLPHAQTHAVVLPYVLAFNAPHAPEAERRMAAAFSADTALEGLNRLRDEVNAPRRLSDYGFHPEDAAEAAQIALEIIPPSNPRSVTLKNLTDLLLAVTCGDDPASVPSDN